MLLVSEASVCVAWDELRIFMMRNAIEYACSDCGALEIHGTANTGGCGLQVKVASRIKKKRSRFKVQGVIVFKKWDLYISRKQVH